MLLKMKKEEFVCGPKPKPIERKEAKYIRATMSGEDIDDNNNEN